MINGCLKEKTFEEAKQLLSGYKYALVYMISEVILEETDKLSEIDWEECKEAYFFDSKGQLHIYKNEEEEGFQVIEFVSGKLSYVERKYALATKFNKTGKTVSVREYLDNDADGQSYVVYTSLYDIK
jgi:hypothetical protein